MSVHRSDIATDPDRLLVAPPVTGGWSGPRIQAQHVRHGRERGAVVRVAGLDGQPVRERAVERRRHAWAASVGWAFASASLLIVTGAVHLLLSGAGPTTTGAVVASLAVLVGVLALRVHRSARVRAVELGSRVIAVVDGRGRGPWVEFHRLAEVELRDDRREPVLSLRDLDSRGVVLPCGLVEANPELWALLYAGIASSAAAGASVPIRTRRHLELPTRLGSADTTTDEDHDDDG